MKALAGRTFKRSIAADSQLDNKMTNPRCVKKTLKTRRYAAYVMFAACLTCSCGAQFYTISNNNSSVIIDVASGPGGTSAWNIDGVNQLKAKWFYYRVGNSGGEHAIEAINGFPSVSSSSNSLGVTYSNATCDVRILHSLTGGSINSGSSQLRETITISNSSASNLELHFFLYSDFDLAGTAGGQSANFQPSNLGFFDKAIQTDGTRTITQTLSSSTPVSHIEAALYNQTLTKLTDANPTTLNDSQNSLLGDATFASQFSVTLARRAAFQIRETNDFTTIFSPATINTQPESLLAAVGANAIFSVSATGVQPLKYQWQFNGTPIINKTNTSLSLTNIQLANAGGYSVVVTNSYGSATSSTANLTVISPPTLVTTTRTATGGETTPAVLVSCPISPSQFKKFVSGSFTSSTTLNPSQMTIILTHGWLSNPNEWAANMAALISSQLSGSTPNIVAWDWSCAASTGCDVGTAAKRTGGQGTALGETLANALGPSYSQRIHFIGHSLGTLVNANAAEYLHNHGFAPANTHMTLFDEAEVGTEFGCLNFLGALYPLWDPLVQRAYYYHPLPQQQPAAWADNYVSFAGLLHTNARNVILTNGLPSSGQGVWDWIINAKEFHAYPMNWYGQTISNPLSADMGFRWSFEEGGFAGAPTNGSVYLQSDSELSLVPIAYSTGTNLLSQRINKYRTSLLSAGMQTALPIVQYSGSVAGLLITSGVNVWNAVINLTTSSGGSLLAQEAEPHPLGNNGGNTANSPALAWTPLNVPSNAVSMAFDFTLQGDGQSDSFAVALDGTNVLSLSVNTVQTNVLLNSGPIDVVAYAGQQVELFMGLVGGSSTNASVTVSNFQFYVVSPPILQAQLSDSSLITSWPLSSSDYVLESNSTLTGTNTWTTLTNAPAIVDLQNTVTNPISADSQFYRLRKQ